MKIRKKTEPLVLSDALLELADKWDRIAKGFDKMDMDSECFHYEANAAKLRELVKDASNGK